MAPNEKDKKPQKPDAEAPSHGRWWIERRTRRDRERAPRPPGDGNVAGASFYSVAAGYDQNTARTRLTDLNLKLLAEGNPPTDGWGYLQMTTGRFPARTFERIKRALPLPNGVRALAVDSGVSLRVILATERPGQRLLELRFGEESSFDAWVEGEWVYEAIFHRLPDALKAAPTFLTRYLPTPRGTPVR